MRPEKKSIVSEIHELLEHTGFVFLVDYKGMTVQQLADLRARLRAFDSRLTIVKNTLLTHAGGANMSGLLQGPTAMITGTGDAGQVAKTLSIFIREHDQRPALKGGRFEGTVLSASDVDAIAKIPPREQLLSILVGTIAAPMSQLVGVMQQKLCSLLYVLKAAEEKKGGQAA